MGRRDPPGVGPGGLERPAGGPARQDRGRRGQGPGRDPVPVEEPGVQPLREALEVGGVLADPVGGGCQVPRRRRVQRLGQERQDPQPETVPVVPQVAVAGILAEVQPATDQRAGKMLYQMK